MKAHFRYLSYVLRHKWFVLRAGLRVRAPLWRLLIHDWSKFTPAEWGPYVANFYGLAPGDEAFEWYQRMKHAAQGSLEGFSHADNEALKKAEQALEGFIVDSRQAAYDRAWLHHQHVNAHHWQHWLLRMDDGPTVALEMPAPLVLEMVADWMGAGRAITGRWDVREWYERNREIIVLHAETRRLVDALVEAAP